MSRPLHVLVVAPARHALRQPHAGGLEAVVWERVRSLRARGHRVTLCGPDGSDFLGTDPRFVLPRPVWDAAADASDTVYPDGYLEQVEDAMAGAFAAVADTPRTSVDAVDVVDNHSLHSTPIEWAERMGVPMVTTLHTPPLPSIIGAHWAAADADHAFVAVSGYTAREWAAFGVDAEVVPNGVDAMRWRAGKGGRRLVWFGRIVPEKAPHLAIDAARLAGRQIVLAGRIGDEDYFDSEVRPRLGRDVRYVGALRQRALARLVGRSAAALVTPVWEEPFGLVIAEALATGTPVAAFECCGVGEVAGMLPGAALVEPGDVAALAAAADMLARTTGRRDRARVREAAMERHALARRHVEWEQRLASAVSGVRGPAVV